MTAISAALVKELRECTGAGMMECKQALEVVGGDLEKAIEELRKRGRTKASKIAGRIAAEGAILIDSNSSRTAMLELNCETDFVAKDANFLGFAEAVLKTVLATGIDSVSQLAQTVLDGTSQTIEEARQALAAKVGENVQIRRVVILPYAGDLVGKYLHGSRIGVVVALEGGNQELARDVAMHIAAAKPLVIAQEQVASDLIEKEKEIFRAQAATSGKPADIIEKMITGRLKKFLDEVSLLGQAFVKDPDVSVGQLLAKHQAKVLAFHRFEAGEGIEKVTEDFKEAVMSQIQGT